MTFPTLHPALARALAARGYETATPVQLAVLESGCAGRDLLVSAQTGSGKTVAFGLALGPDLLGEAERLPPASAPLALIIAPTRELAMQVSRELTWLYESAGARVVTCVGGMDPRAEARQLEAGAHIVVGTPGRLRDHLERRRLDFSGLKAAVLDEADEMLDLGFREDLEFILDATPAGRRSLLFSATVSREIETLAGRFQREAVRIATGRRDEQHADIEYLAHRVVPHDVENAVVNVLRFHEARAALVFCTTREAVKRLSARLAERGFSAVSLSGELTQHERSQALQALRDGRARVLVATDVAARGLDLPDLALVIHAELPNDGETLLHRSGRTGRAGRKGMCVLIVPYNRRRKAEAVLGSARLRVMWRPAPEPEAIRARDQERFLAESGFSGPASDQEAELVRALQAARSADEIALALVRLHSAQLPAPEELTPDTGPPPRREQPWRTKGDRGVRESRTWAQGRERNNYKQARDGASEPRHGDREEGAQGGHGGGWAERRSGHDRPRHDAEQNDAVPAAQGDARPEAHASAGQEVPAHSGGGERRWEKRRDTRSQARSDSRSDAGSESRSDSRPPRARRDDSRPMSWFRINIGRNRNADPRWLLPLICRAGGVTKSEIGAIRVDDRETRFQILADAADEFERSARTLKEKEGHIVRADAHGGDGGFAPAGQAAAPSGPAHREPGEGGRPPHQRPHGKKFGKPGKGGARPWAKSDDNKGGKRHGHGDGPKPHRKGPRPEGSKPYPRKQKRPAGPADAQG